MTNKMPNVLPIPLNSPEVSLKLWLMLKNSTPLWKWNLLLFLLELKNYPPNTSLLMPEKLCLMFSTPKEKPKKKDSKLLWLNTEPSSTLLMTSKLLSKPNLNLVTLLNFWNPKLLCKLVSSLSLKTSTLKTTVVLLTNISVSSK